MDNGMSYYQTSAKENTNVNEAFQSIVDEAAGLKRSQGVIDRQSKKLDRKRHTEQNKNQPGDPKQNGKKCCKN